MAGSHADYSRAQGAAHISAQGQQREQKRAAPFEPGGGYTESPGPEDAHGEAAQPASDQAGDGRGGQGDQKVAGQTQDAAEIHEFAQIELFPVFSIDSPGAAH